MDDENENIVSSSRIISTTSKSQRLRAVIKEIDSKQYLQVWQQTNMFRSVDLAALDIHGKVYEDVEFSTLEFSPDESKLLYVAEKKILKSDPFYKRTKSETATSDDDSTKSARKGEEFVFEQDWGEQLVTKKISILAQYNIEKDSVEILEGLPDGVCVAKTKYSSDGNAIFGIAYFIEPRKLGLIYCTNRSSTLFQLDFIGNYVELQLDNKAIKTPILTPTGNEVVWLQRDAEGPHHACMQLVKTKMPITENNIVEVVVDIVSSVKEISNSRREFYGLYNTSFPTRPWLNDSTILLSTNQKCQINSYAIDLWTGEITELVFDNGSQIILDVKDNLVLAVRRNFFVPDVLVVGKVGKSIEVVEWVEITPKIDVEELGNSIYQYLHLTAPEGAVVDFNAIYLGPSSGTPKSVPLIVWPHGGPHAAFANYFFLEEALFLSLGYAVLFINYRGSVGSGNDSVYFLLGKVGTADVNDCVQAVDHVLQEYPWINPDQLALCGGSHGGFLVTHLSGQYPDKFNSVVARNPVIDVASMSIISDIPDWCFIEAGHPYTQKGEIDNKALLDMREASPIVHAHKVKAPTLLQIGSKDLRVPPHQSNEYYLRLKANGVKVRMNLYDDNHPLGKVGNEIDNIINTIRWTDEHLGRE